jgi:adenylate cyclase
MGKEMIPHLAEFYDLMSKCISQNRGTIDKYIGDCVMAFWGAPVASESHPSEACRTALQCQTTLAEYRSRSEQETKLPFYARIGINTGTVLVGNIGSEEKMDYTVIGDPVNVASRLEALNKVYGTEIIIGQVTYELAKDDILSGI